MKLLIVTQAIDTEDPVLGFFARWVAELAQHVEHIEVICLKEGKHDLPVNVHVHSLGKEKGTASRLGYARRFLVLAWSLHTEYDAVFVHMNQEYILIAGWIWKLLGKRVYMWRNHYAGSWLTDSAASFCTKVFCTSRYSYTAKYAKTVIMPIGIDTAVFKPEGGRKLRSVLFLARMAPSKRPDVLLEAFGILLKKDVDFTASLYGLPTQADEKYYEQLKHRTEELNLHSRVQFRGAVPNTETPTVYSAHDVCVNLSPSGMYDKTIFESASCGCLSLTSNRNLIGLIDDRLLFEEGNSGDLEQKLAALLEMREEEKQILRVQLRKFVEEHHSLKLLGEVLSEELKVSDPRRHLPSRD